MPLLWTFRCYVTARGEDVVRTWYDAQSKKTRAKFLSRLQALAAAPGHEWRPPLFRWLDGNCRDVGEVRFKTDVQHRPLGFAIGNVFYIALCAMERGSRFEPRTACDIVNSRRRDIEAKQEHSNALWLKLE